MAQFSGKIAEAFVDIRTNSARFKKDMAGVKGSLLGLQRTAKLVSAAFMGLFIAGRIARGIRSVTTAFIENQDASVKLNATLAATGNIVGFSAEQLSDFADELRKSSRFTRDALLDAQALMTTFVEIRGIDFKDAMKMVVQLSAVFKQDLKTSVIQLSKALNDPIRGLGRLRKVGVSFTDTQMKAIQAMFRMGKAAEAQQEILRLMKEQGLDKVSDAMQDTLGGAIAGLKNDLKELNAEWGSMIDELVRGQGEIDNTRTAIQRLQEALAQGSFARIWVNNMKAVGSAILAGIMVPLDMVKSAIDDFKTLATGVFDTVFNSLFGNAQAAAKALDKMTNPESYEGVNDAMENLAGTFEAIKKQTRDREKEINKAFQKEGQNIDANTKRAVEGEKKKRAARKGTADSLRSLVQQSVLGQTITPALGVAGAGVAGIGAGANRAAGEIVGAIQAQTQALLNKKESPVLT